MAGSPPGLHWAHSQLEIKSFDAEQRIIRGVATTPSPDRVGDIVEPNGAHFKLPIPLLWQHRADEPIGEVFEADVTPSGIEVSARIAKIDTPGLLRDRLELAWQSIAIAKLVRGLSIGFKDIESTPIANSFSQRFLKWLWLELSTVTIPANADASIALIKSIDAANLAALGTRVRRPVVHLAGASAFAAKTAMPTYQERITSLENTRAAKAAELDTLQTKVADEGRTKDESERETFNTLKSEIKSIDEELIDLRDLAQMNLQKAQQAAPVAGANPQQAAQSRVSTQSITVKSELPPGLGFTRYTIAKVMAQREGMTVMEFAKQRWPSHAELHSYIQTKATVPAATTTDATWLGPLVYNNNLPGEFLEFLRARTLLGRIPGLRRAPFNVRFTSQTSGAVANWVGQGKGKPVTSFSTAAQTLARTKIAAIAVITEEVAKDSTPSAEMLVRDELARAVIERMDIDFVDPAHAAVANVNPASITNGLTALSSAGTAEANIRTDLQNLLEGFIVANLGVEGLVLLMPDTLALSASLMVNSLGQPSFPSINTTGGSLMGIPVITSQYLANASGSGNLVIALRASEIFVADDGQVNVDASREASIQMTDAPTVDSTTGTGASLVSMYQTNSIAIRAERSINWVKARSSAVVYMDDVNWGSIGSPS